MAYNPNNVNGQATNANSAPVVLASDQLPVAANFMSGNATTTGTSDISVAAGAGGGLRNYITDICISNSGVTTSPILIKDGAGGATLWQTIAPAGGGSNISLKTAVPGSVNTGVYVTATSASTTISCSISGYKGA